LAKTQVGVAPPEGAVELPLFHVEGDEGAATPTTAQSRGRQVSIDLEHEGTLEKSEIARLLPLAPLDAREIESQRKNLQDLVEVLKVR
jgi:acetolactate synthase small subunit